LKQFIVGAAAVAGALLLTAPAALALPPIGSDPVPHCPRGYEWDGDGCVKLPPLGNSPLVSLDLARQSTNRAAIRVTGRATDADEPATPLSVQIRVDGALVSTITADKADPPVATPNTLIGNLPPTGPAGHSYDVNVPAPAGAQQVCVTALNLGAGANATLCKAVDRVLEFAGSSISYDVDHIQITDSHMDALDRVTNTNLTNIQQSTTISGEKTVTDTSGWSDTEGTKISVTGGIKIPLFSDFKVTVEGSVSFTQNGSTAIARKFAWSQPVLVPSHSKVVATVAVTSTTLSVPYSISGDYVYASGLRVAGKTGGLYTGVNSHDLQATVEQFNLDGTPVNLVRRLI
jgi:hypothetical protein